MWPTRGAGTNEELTAIRGDLSHISGDLSRIMRRLMQMDEKLDRIVWLLDEEGGDDEAAPEDDA